MTYLIHRLILIIPTIFLILLFNFFLIQLTPGGPIEHIMAQLSGLSTDTLGQNENDEQAANSSGYADEALREKLNKQFGFDQPIYMRFIKMIQAYSHFDFGSSYFDNQPVIDLIKSKLPVSISLGLWSTLIIYLISVPIGIRKANKAGSMFDFYTSLILSLVHAIPGFLLALLLITIFAGGTYFQWFPLGGLASDTYSDLSLVDKIKDYVWHLILPIVAFSMAGFAQLTLLTKNAFLEEINKQYVVALKAKGLADSTITYRHIFKNAMLIIIVGFPSVFVSAFFTGSLLIESIFSLDGLGLLSFNALMKRDYPVIFGSLFIFTLIGLFIKIVADLLSCWIDPRIHFSSATI